MSNPEPTTFEPTPAPVPAPEPAPPAPEVKPEDEAAELRTKLAEYEAKEREAEQAKLSEAERLKGERDALERERFQFELQRAGIPETLARHFGAVEGKKRGVVLAEIGEAFAAAVKAEAAKLAPAAPAKPAVPGNPIVPPAQAGNQKPANPYADIAKSMRARKP